MREAREKTVKTFDRAADLADRIKKPFLRTAEQAQSLSNNEQSTPSEYAGNKVEYAAEDITSETGHTVIDTGKRAYRSGKSAIRNAREKNMTESETTAHSGTRHGGTLSGKTPSESGANVRTTQSKTGADAIRREQQFKRMVRQNNNSVKAVQRTEKTIKQTKRATEQSVKNVQRSVKGTQKAVKTAEQSSKVAIKTSKDAAKAAQKSAQASAKAAQKAAQFARAAARAAVKAAKAIVKALKAIVKAIIQGAKELGAAIVSGGWVSVIIIVVIMLVAMIVCSYYGIFFSSESGFSQMTMQGAVREINMEYLDSLDAIRNTTVYDRMETSGSRASWPEVLAFYAVKLNSDAEDPQEVATMNVVKKSMLSKIFWEMNQIYYYTETAEEIVIVEEADEDGNIIATETTAIVTTLYITVVHKTAEAMAEEYSFTDEQKQMLSDLLLDENASLWAAVLYGIHSPDEQIVAVAESQLGNIGGEPYWRWYGFNSRVAWCACFVSWCANECGYIEAGIIPKFAGCVQGVRWFRQRDQWIGGEETPIPGMLIFFDHDTKDGKTGMQDGLSDHVGIVQKVEDGYVYTIEGNYDDSCALGIYSIGYFEILGYGILCP